MQEEFEHPQGFSNILKYLEKAMAYCVLPPPLQTKRHRWRKVLNHPFFKQTKARGKAGMYIP